MPILWIVMLLFACVAPVYARDALDRSEPAEVRQGDWIVLAVDLERHKDWQGLLNWGKQWARVEPSNATAWFVQGRALSEMRRYPEAIEAYRQNLLIEAGDVFALNNLGNAYRDSKRFREAMTAYRDAVQINPDYLPAWHNLGLTFYALKGAAGVTLAIRQLSVTDPDLAEAWRKLAIEYSLSRDQRVAQKAIGVLRGLDADKRRRMFEILFVNV